MAAKQRIPSKPTVYLDHSTLCDAFRAHAFGATNPADRAYGPLFQWIERVAKEANLCLSLYHLAELARWGDGATADAMARWYDQLPIVWARSVEDVQDAEDEYWTKVAAGVTPSCLVSPFAPSLLATVREAPLSAVAALLAQREPTVALVHALRKRGQDDFIATFISVAQRVREDRAWAEEQNWSEERKRETTAYKRRVDLRKRAMEADRRLSARGDAEYSGKGCTAGDVQDLLVDLFERDPKALPCLRAMQRYNEGLFAFAMKRSGPSSNERKALAGSFHDLEHAAVGAAYCDVFTCDARVAEWLGDLRERLGLPGQLAVGSHSSGATGFVGDLTATYG